MSTGASECTRTLTLRLSVNRSNWVYTNLNITTECQQQHVPLSLLSVGSWSGRWRRERVPACSKSRCASAVSTCSSSITEDVITTRVTAAMSSLKSSSKSPYSHGKMAWNGLTTSKRLSPNRETWSQQKPVSFKTSILSAGCFKMKCQGGFTTSILSPSCIKWNVQLVLPYRFCQSSILNKIGALSQVNHKGLYHGWRRLSQRDI